MNDSPVNEGRPLPVLRDINRLLEAKFGIASDAEGSGYFPEFGILPWTAWKNRTLGALTIPRSEEVVVGAYILANASTTSSFTRSFPVSPLPEHVLSRTFAARRIGQH